MCVITTRGVIALNLQELRTRKGLTQEGLAKALGLSRAAYTNIENGRRRPSVKVAKKIGVILDFDWSKLFDNEGRSA